MNSFLSSLFVVFTVVCQRVRCKDQQAVRSTSLSQRQTSETNKNYQELIDCQVGTVIISHSGEDGTESSTVQYKCISYAEEESDGAHDMVYDLPDWFVNKYHNTLESDPTYSYLRIYNGSLSRGEHAYSTEPLPQQQQQQLNLRSSSYTNQHYSLPQPQPLVKLLNNNDDAGTSLPRVVADDTSAVVEFSRAPFREEAPWFRRRRLAKTQGNSKVLFVRVTTNDASLDIDAATISERVFGSGAGTVASSLGGCSFGKLNIVKATGNGIQNGVVDLFINKNIQGASIFALENTMANELAAVVGDVSGFDHVAYCVPNGSYKFEPSDSAEWLAYGYVGWHRTVYNGAQCGYLSKIVHEFGHNLGLGHSGDGQVSYADKSGIMGYGYDQVHGPIMCFNAAKNWQLGWYSNKRVAVSVPWKGRLYGYTDYSKNLDGNTVLINVGDLYIQYNKIATINRDTGDKTNQVAIVRSTTKKNSVSTSLAGLDATSDNSAHTVENFSGSQDLVIEVCEYVPGSLDYFQLSIRFQGQPSLCGRSGPLPQPSPSPTRQPTFAPTIMANIAPNPTPPPTSIQVTSAPVPAPTRDPTRDPTREPTSPPTPFPRTPFPSRKPTAQPSTVPTPRPTPIPSFQPSEFPSGMSSARPSVSTNPSGLPTSELVCDDHLYAKFPTDNVTGLQSCIWLAARPAAQSKYCVASHAAYKICEETCGSCQDNCKDVVGGTFDFHGIERPCSWLSIRPRVQAVVCADTDLYNATKACPETCNTCDNYNTSFWT